MKRYFLGVSACLLTSCATDAGLPQMQPDSRVPLGSVEATSLICEGVAQQPLSVAASTDVYGNASSSVSGGGATPLRREILFNEELGQLWYRGAPAVSRDGEVNGWVPALTVKFEGPLVKATFKPSTYNRLEDLSEDIITLGLSRAIRPDSLAVLNRNSGTWSVDGSYIINCSLADSQKKF